MTVKGGTKIDPRKMAEEILRADLCARATSRCYIHGAAVVDDLLKYYDISRKPMKEKV